MQLDAGPRAPRQHWDWTGRRHHGHHAAHWRTALMAAGLATTTLGVAACGGGGGGGGTPTPQPSRPAPTSSTTPGSTANRGDLKPVLRGLLDRSGIPPAGFEQVMGGYVVNVYWRDLQPQQGGPIATNNVLDQAIAQVRQANASNGTNWGLRLRLYAGLYAPDWAKNLGGAPVAVTDPQTGQSGTVGRFWTPEFGAAYTALQQAMAARYDSVPELRDVTISRCTTVFAEPLIRDTRDPATVAALLGAGYTVAADQQCHHDALQAHTVWQHTRSDLALNPYQVVTGTGRGKVDEAFTEQLMLDCRVVLARRCVLENNSLAEPTKGPMYDAMYAAMQQNGAPITFQTATLDRVGSLDSALQAAHDIGATSVELPSGYDSLGAAHFTAASQALAGNDPGD